MQAVIEIPTSRPFVPVIRIYASVRSCIKGVGVSGNENFDFLAGGYRMSQTNPSWSILVPILLIVIVIVMVHT